ncbi:MAG: hypothetical protein ACFC1C_03905 [Candidatus Malihini olakiniferum]
MLPAVRPVSSRFYYKDQITPSPCSLLFPTNNCNNRFTGTNAGVDAHDVEALASFLCRNERFRWLVCGLRMRLIMFLFRLTLASSYRFNYSGLSDIDYHPV